MSGFESVWVAFALSVTPDGGDILSDVGCSECRVWRMKVAWKGVEEIGGFDKEVGTLG